MGADSAILVYSEFADKYEKIAARRDKKSRKIKKARPEIDAVLKKARFKRGRNLQLIYSYKITV